MRRLLVVLIALILLSEVFSGLGIGTGAHAAIASFVRHGHRGLSSALLAAMIIYGLRSERTNRNAALALGLALEVGHALLLRDPVLAFTNFGGGFGLASLIVAGIDAARTSAGRDGRLQRLLETSLFPLFALAAVLPTELTVFLHPHTLDARLLAMDASIFGGQPSFAVGRAFTDQELLRLFGSLVSASLPAVGAVVWSVEQRTGRTSNLLIALLGAGLVGLAIHQLLPAAGPGSFWPLYPYEAISPSRASSMLDMVGTRERIGVPCVPIAWSLLVYWYARPLGWRMRSVAAVVLVLTLLAIIGLGEHYLVDVIITIPFALAVRAAFARRWYAVAVAAVGFALWLIVARTPLVESAFLLRLLAIVTTVGTFLFERRIEAVAVRPVTASRPAPMDGRARVIAIIFFASGFAGLLYEVVFAKELALVFGSTAVASTTVLATYMGGMALGAAVGGRLKFKSALRAYGICELGIAVSCALSPAIIRLVRAAYVAIAAEGDPGRPSIVVLQVILGASVLLPPTVLMGMTLPILARYFERVDPTLGRSVALLYTANTAGAATGALLAGYFLLPFFGIFGTTLIGVLANAMVALGALRLAARGPTTIAEKAPEERRRPEPSEGGWLGVAALGVGGVVSLGLEITYNHLLAIVVGNSTYAFSSMLVSFLVGLSGGAAVGRRWLRARLSLAAGIGLAQAGLVVVVLLGVFAWNGVPEYFESYARFTYARTFPITELVRFVVCVCLLVPPAFFVGISYPISIEAVVRASKTTHERALGNGAAINTLGNITGALVTGFVLIPWLGSLRTLHALTAVTTALSVGAVTLSRRERLWPVLVGAVAIAVGLFACQPSSFDLDRLASGANVYFRSQRRGAVIDSAESLEGGLTTVCREQKADGETMNTLMTNGKFQGNDSLIGEMRAQYGLTLMPLLHSTARGSALVIGFGTGASTRAVHEAGFARVEVAELSRDIVTMAGRHFSRTNGDVLSRPNVSVSYTDGRNFLLLQGSNYDFIGVEISSIWFAGAASLYNVDFYALTKRRLAKEGVFQQWIQIHHVDASDITSMLASIRAVYDRVWLYVAGGQGVVVACAFDCAPSEEARVKLDETPALADGIALLGGSAAELAKSRILAPTATDRLLEAAGATPVERERLMSIASTDDNSFLEYHTPRGNIRSDAEYEKNLAFIRSFAQSR